MGKKKPNIIECDGLVVRGRNGEKRAEISASIVAGGPDVAYAAKVHYDLDLQHETGQSHFIHQPFFEASGRPMLRRLAAGIDLKRAAR